MESLLWLLVPLAAALGASLWAWYVSRPHPADVWTDVDRYDRLRAALARGTGGGREGDPAGAGAG
ncbi:hypothetical protein LUX12_01390 [Streptomyces somaliensis]|uniref:hypothetical protein n=1 Tax=Streptomyces somaliensis TaxID=78355 RepID=UPI0020CBB8B7|nr:hypothetical protein [Streptomyces somaliensis]MCP9943760.1 hypothetical protein [Streptomyces somaliensis]MCP9962990.1 hypothetical protein [Streptomyces somaliensis]MCP9975839.1 hypothetical protein [Streptomyces somaliensis]